MSIVVVFIVVAVVAVVAQVGYRVYDQRWFAQNGVQVQGSVVSVRVRRNTSFNATTNTSSTTRRYVPTVRFMTTDGQTVETETPSMGRRRVDPGSGVLIAYDPNNPSRARIMW